MPVTANLDPRPGSRLCEFMNLRQPWCLVLLFAILMVAQTLSLLIFGTGRIGSASAVFVLVLDSLLALSCTWTAFRRAPAVATLFWFLFAATLLILLIPTIIQVHDILYDPNILSNSTWRLLYCIYGAPILMMLFLSETHGGANAKSEIFLDLFQITIVVALIYSSFFFIPVEGMSPTQALQRNINISDTQSLLLLVAVLVRLQFVRTRSARSLLLRLGLFLLACGVVTAIGDWIDLHQYLTASAWFNLVWAIPQVVAGLVALTWVPGPEPVPEPANFFSFLATNLVLVTMLVGLNLLMDRWKQTYGEALAVTAIAASLIAFTFRLALTQFHQQQEIFRRKAAQEQVTASNDKIGRLLDSSRRQTAEITQISELGSLLQACTSREEVFRLIPERMRRLFPDASGSISLISASKIRLESFANWGVGSVGQVFSMDECWALRRRSVHVHPRGQSAARCSHLLGDGASICIPLLATGDTVGVLSIQDNDLPASISEPDPDSDSDSDHSARQHHLATAVAEHISLAVANLGLRETLRLQAVRDPLTGLYNRRYMQEFLERELHSARRKHRPLSVMMLDLDHFKRYNDNFGHAAGDCVLATVGQTLVRSIRAEDVACRYGGEEFTLILPECSLTQAMTRAEQIRVRLTETCSEHGARPTDSVTVSIGLAAFDETTDRVDLLLKFADDALYEAKRAGRNRVVSARPASALPAVNFAGKDTVTLASSSG